MPVRDKAVARALKSLGLRVWYNNMLLTANVDGIGEMPRDQFDRDIWEPVDRAYEAVVDSIDWNRVFLEACARHIELKHEDENYGMICEECLNEALLAKDTWIDWKRTPDVPRYDDDTT